QRQPDLQRSRGLPEVEIAHNGGEMRQAHEPVAALVIHELPGHIQQRWAIAQPQPDSQSMSTRLRGIQAAAQAYLEVILEQRLVEVTTELLHPLGLGPVDTPDPGMRALQRQDEVFQKDVGKGGVEGLLRGFAAWRPNDTYSVRIAHLL